MEKSANTVQKCLPIPTVDDYGINTESNCVFLDSTEEWHDLEQFWEDPRHKFQEFEKPSHPLSSSLERHLLFDDCLQAPFEQEEPIKDSKDDTYFNDSESVIRGEDINDIPTQYTITGFRPNELIVIGTYVDKRVIPGFKYVVRKNLSERYLFGKKPLTLQQVGLGYGKRITFEGSSLNNNTNYFWSDSCTAGFGFILSVLNLGDVFGIYNSFRQQYCGRITVTGIKNQKLAKSIVFGNDGRVEKLVEVEFTCDIIYVDCTNKQTLVVQDTVAVGTALVVKENHSAVAEIEHIELSRFVVDDCLLKPEN